MTAQSGCQYRYIIRYIPIRLARNKGFLGCNRKLVYDFKRGVMSERYMQKILDSIMKITEGRQGCWAVTFVPASTQERTERRFSALTEFLRERLSCPVYLHSIKSYKDYEPIHKHGVKAFKLHSIYAEHFSGKNVILIDDVLTTGRTMNDMSRKLRRIGALSVFGLCFAKTINPEFQFRQYSHYIYNKV